MDFSEQGVTWSAPVEASQPAGAIKCGSAWPKMLPNGDVVMPCAAGHSARSSDGGRSWKLSTKPISLNTNVTGVTGLCVRKQPAQLHKNNIKTT